MRGCGGNTRHSLYTRSHPRGYSPRQPRRQRLGGRGHTTRGDRGGAGTRRQSDLASTEHILSVRGVADLFTEADEANHAGVDVQTGLGHAHTRLHTVAHDIHVYHDIIAGLHTLRHVAVRTVDQLHGLDREVGLHGDDHTARISGALGEGLALLVHTITVLVLPGEVGGDSTARVNTLSFSLHGLENSARFSLGYGQTERVNHIGSAVSLQLGLVVVVAALLGDQGIAPNDATDGSGDINHFQKSP